MPARETVVRGVLLLSMAASVPAQSSSTVYSGPAAVRVNLTIDSAHKTHRMRPLDMGCHSDTGYSHQPMGLHAQRIYGPSFESPPVSARTDGTGWLDVSRGSGVAEQDTTTAFHGSASEKLVLTGGGAARVPGTGRAAVANRGLGNEGLYFQGAKGYEGYFFAKADKPTKLVLSIEAWGGSASPKVLAKTTILVRGSSASGRATDGGWHLLNFSLTPSATTECKGLVPESAKARAFNITCPVNQTYDPTSDMSDRTAHVCVWCGGQFVMALEEPGQVHLDFVYLAPGQWGRLKGLPVLAEGAKWLADMGTKIFRMGGSFCDDSAYFWKRWRGKPWTRPTVSTSWGHDFEGGWGPFESIDMANAMDIVAVMTTFAVGDVQMPATRSDSATTRPLTPEDMADLVEYSFGDATTKWGKIRIEEDQHPTIYNWSYIELGNEQYNPDFVEQVAAMEARAKKVGMGGKLNYLFPSSWNAVPQGVNATDAPKAAALGMGDRLLCDLHTLDGYIVPPTRPLQMDLDQIGQHWGVPRFHDVLQSNTTGPQGWGALNLETNCGDHTLRRALEEGYDLNMFANEGNLRLKGRAASFCMERSGYQEGGLNDQGLVFFLVRNLH
eukprot:COSAG03_NODE_1049_length_4950_cov_49.608534_2_plen_611_part_00